MKRIIVYLLAVGLLAWASIVTAKCRIEHREAYYEAMTAVAKVIVLERAYIEFSRDWKVADFR